jgi:hypothetical protein
MSNSLIISHHRAQVVADAVVSAYINELATPERHRLADAQAPRGHEPRFDSPADHSRGDDSYPGLVPVWREPLVAA